MKALINARIFLSVKWYWAKEKPLVWANLGLMIGTVLLIFCSPGETAGTAPSDAHIRFWAMGLQLLGAWTVWHDLTSSASSFGKKGILRETLDWLKAGFFGRIHRVQGSCGTAYGIASAGRIKQRLETAPGSSIELRIEALEFNLSKLDEEISSAFKTIEERSSSLREQLLLESQKREAAHAELRESFQAAIAGNFGTLAFGAFWVAVGIVLSGIAPELAKLVATVH